MFSPALATFPPKPRQKNLKSAEPHNPPFETANLGRKTSHFALTSNQSLMNQFLAGLTLLLCAVIPRAQSLDFAAPVTLGNINTDLLPEASGIVASRANPNVFWTHNDGPRT